jgi:hypothetical protein
MRRPAKVIIAFAVFGLAMGFAAYAYHSVVHYVDPFNRRDVNLNELIWFLCPAQVVLGFCIDCEPAGTGSFIMYSIVAVLNAALFALVGLVVVSLWNEPPDNSLKIDE